MKHLLFSICAILLLSSCGLVQQQRVKEFRQQMISDPALPNEIRDAIINNQIKVGMTKDQVIASWGLPCEICYGTRRSSSGDTWEYNPGGTTSLGIGAGTYLYFDTNDVLRHWSGP